MRLFCTVVLNCKHTILCVIKLYIFTWYDTLKQHNIMHQFSAEKVKNKYTCWALILHTHINNIKSFFSTRLSPSSSQHPFICWNGPIQCILAGCFIFPTLQYFTWAIPCTLLFFSDHKKTFVHSAITGESPRYKWYEKHDYEHDGMRRWSRCCCGSNVEWSAMRKCHFLSFHSISLEHWA